MSYASQELLADRYGEDMLIDLTDRAEPAAGTVDADVVARALADTDAAIDGYLLGRYALPLSETPALLTDLALSIAIYKLHRRAPDPKIEADYQAAMATLRDIARGTVRLAVAGVEPAASGTGEVRTNDPERPFTAATMKGFI